MKSKKKYSLVKMILLTLVTLTALSSLFMLHPQFGKRPSGERLERIENSPQFKQGKFRNINHTPQITQSIPKTLYEVLFKKSKLSKPDQPFEVVQTNWEDILQHQNHLIWLGHSTYFIMLDGKSILVDPVLSGSVSPIPGSGKSFSGTELLALELIPEIDYVLLTHDHYDHMDYKTLQALQSKIQNIIVPLGVGSHLEHWGYEKHQIIEKDWWDEIHLDPEFTITLTPARHFSGRSIWSGNTLWTSYVLQSRFKRIYIGGDSGYDTHFKDIGQKLGPFDLAILENGQYNPSWKHIHMTPEEVIQATKDLKAQVVLPVHSSKFVLSNHSWNEPLERVSNQALKENQDIVTPLIGQAISLEAMDTKPTYWWR